MGLRFCLVAQQSSKYPFLKVNEKMRQASSPYSRSWPKGLWSKTVSREQVCRKKSTRTVFTSQTHYDSLIPMSFPTGSDYDRKVSSIIYWSVLYEFYLYSFSSSELESFVLQRGKNN